MNLQLGCRGTQYVLNVEIFRSEAAGNPVYSLQWILGQCGGLVTSHRTAQSFNRASGVVVYAGSCKVPAS